MRDPIPQLPVKNLTANNLADLNLGRSTPRPDRSEITAILHQPDALDGFSMEWMLDRFTGVRVHDGRHA